MDTFSFLFILFLFPHNRRCRYIQPSDSVHLLPAVLPVGLLDVWRLCPQRSVRPLSPVWGRLWTSRRKHPQSVKHPQIFCMKFILHQNIVLDKMHICSSGFQLFQTQFSFIHKAPLQRRGCPNRCTSSKIEE